MEIACVFSLSLSLCLRHSRNQRPAARSRNRSGVLDGGCVKKLVRGGSALGSEPTLAGRPGRRPENKRRPTDSSAPRAAVSSSRGVCVQRGFEWNWTSKAARRVRCVNALRILHRALLKNATAEVNMVSKRGAARRWRRGGAPDVNCELVNQFLAKLCGWRQ